MKRAELLNAIASRIAAKSYLEVGVLQGVTFFDVAVPRKVAVDPQFRFEREKLDTPGCKFYEVPSDEYFRHHAGNERFDLIYLDGLHTFEQTLRDLHNGLRCSHAQSVIVIDDTTPNDYFASLPSQQRCLELRATAKLPGRAWMGDVYKTIFYIHDFLPFLSYATIRENHGQTVVWNSPRPTFSPRFDSMEVLARSDYGRLMELPDVMNFLPSAEILRQLPATARSTAAPPNQVIVEALSRVMSTDALFATSCDSQVDLAMPLPAQAEASMFVAPLRPLPDTETRGASALMQPNDWIRHTTEATPIGLGILHGAYAFGGTLLSVSDGRHSQGQLLTTQRGGLIPASYGQIDGALTLPADLVGAGGPDSWSLRSPACVEPLDGTWFFVGSVHRQFGHAVLEGLSRLWALEELPDTTRRELRFVVYESTVPPFGLELLELAGVSRDRIMHLPECARIERLIVPDAAMRTHRWISSLQHRTWSRVRSSVAANAYPTRRVYLSRRTAKYRPLSNEDQIESLFVDAGYEIISPERLSIREQIRLAAETSSLAGPVGSQMYLAAFQQPGARNIVLAPQNFYLKDDFLVSTVTGSRLRVVLGSSIDHHLSKPERRWSVDPALVVQALREV